MSKFIVGDEVYFDSPVKYENYFERQEKEFFNHYGGYIEEHDGVLRIQTVYLDGVKGPLLPLEDVEGKYFIVKAEDFIPTFGRYIESTEKGKAFGVPFLDRNGVIYSKFIPGEKLSSLVLGYFHNGTFYEDPEYTIKIYPVETRLYEDISVSPAILYRWNGETYEALGSSATTAYYGYYHENEFYKNPDFTEPYEKKEDVLYVDKSVNSSIYRYGRGVYDSFEADSELEEFIVQANTLPVVMTEDEAENLYNGMAKTELNLPAETEYLVAKTEEGTFAGFYTDSEALQFVDCYETAEEAYLEDHITAFLDRTHGYILIVDFSSVNARIDDINSLIPNQASIDNQLADKAFVNSSIQTATASFRGAWENWAAIPSVEEDYPLDFAQNRKPTVNDYLVVANVNTYWDIYSIVKTYKVGDVVDYNNEIYKCIVEVTVPGEWDPLHWQVSEYHKGAWRFKYSGDWDIQGKNGWYPEYQINREPLTAAQIAALNSGITEALVGKIANSVQGIRVNGVLQGKDSEGNVNITVQSHEFSTDEEVDSIFGKKEEVSVINDLVVIPGNLVDAGEYLYLKVKQEG